jgi:hypothetical protein
MTATGVARYCYVATDGWWMEVELDVRDTNKMKIESSAPKDSQLHIHMSMLS